MAKGNNQAGRPGDPASGGSDTSSGPWREREPGEEGPPVSRWSDLADLEGPLDEDALLGPGDGPAGGLLGVDSGLLRFLAEEVGVDAEPPDLGPGRSTGGLGALENSGLNDLNDDGGLLLDAEIELPSLEGALPSDLLDSEAFGASSGPRASGGRPAADSAPDSALDSSQGDAVAMDRSGALPKELWDDPSSLGADEGLRVGARHAAAQDDPHLSLLDDLAVDEIDAAGLSANLGIDLEADIEGVEEIALPSIPAVALPPPDPRGAAPHPPRAAKRPAAKRDEAEGTGTWLDDLVDELEMEEGGGDWASGVVSEMFLDHAQAGWGEVVADDAEASPIGAVEEPAPDWVGHGGPIPRAPGRAVLTEEDVRVAGEAALSPLASAETLAWLEEGEPAEVSRTPKPKGEPPGRPALQPSSAPPAARPQVSAPTSRPPPPAAPSAVRRGGAPSSPPMRAPQRSPQRSAQSAPPRAADAWGALPGGDEVDLWNASTSAGAPHALVDPFAAPVSASLEDETAALEDPFDSVSAHVGDLPDDSWLGGTGPLPRLGDSQLIDVPLVLDPGDSLGDADQVDAPSVPSPPAPPIPDAPPPEDRARHADAGRLEVAAAATDGLQVDEILLDDGDLGIVSADAAPPATRAAPRTYGTGSGLPIERTQLGYALPMATTVDQPAFTPSHGVNTTLDQPALVVDVSALGLEVDEEPDWGAIDEMEDVLVPARETPPPAAAAPPAEVASSPSSTAGDAAFGPPTPSELEEARALLAARAAERLAALADDLELAGEAAQVETVLHDSGDKRVVRVERIDLDDLSIASFADGDGEEGPDATMPPSDEGSAELFVFAQEPRRRRRSALDALREAPLELDVPWAPTDDPLAHVDESALEIADEDVVETAPAPATPERPLARGDAAPPDPPADAWWAEAFARPEIAIDLSDIERAGLPLLGTLPPIPPIHVRRPLPTGALAGEPRATVDGPPVWAPLAPLASRDAAEARLDALIEAEIAAETGRGRLALLYHHLGRLAFGRPGGAERARAAFRAGWQNDPVFLLNRWAHHGTELSAGAVEEVVTELARGAGLESTQHADDLYRAGHLAFAALKDEDRAHALWKRASALDPEQLAPRLARALLSLGRLDWVDAERAVAAAAAATSGGTLGSILILERVRLADELSAGVEALDGLLEEALERVGCPPAVSAAIERHAYEHGRLELLLRALRVRYDEVMDRLRSAQISEREAHWELGEVFYKAAWALERLGRRSEALAEYQKAMVTLPTDRSVVQRAGELARRLGRSAEYRDTLEWVARQTSDAAEAANCYYQMGLIAHQVLADDATAAGDFERALRASPGFTPALAALGRLSIRQGRWIDLQQRYADEIEQLERAHRSETRPEVKARIAAGLLSRYYRVARLLEQTLGETGLAAEYDERALSLDPGWTPAFHARERSLERAEKWSELLALFERRVARVDDPAEAAALWVRAADVARIYRHDDLLALRMLARALDLAPGDVYALRQAAAGFGRLGYHGARIDVELRLAEAAAPPGDSLPALLRAGELQLCDGDPGMAATEALPVLQRALEIAPDNSAVLDALWRAVVRLNRVGVLARRFSDPALSPPRSPMQAQIIAETLLAGGRPLDASSFLARWREVDAASASRASPDAGLLALEAIAAERAESWRRLIEIYELQSATLSGGRKATLLARIGELWEFRLIDQIQARTAYTRALDASPGWPAATDGLRRLTDSGPPRAPADHAPWLGVLGVPAGAARWEALAALAPTLPAEVGAALQRASQPRVDLQSALISAEQEPDRRDRFEDAWWALLAAGRTAELVGLAWLRAELCSPGERRWRLHQLVDLCLQIGDVGGAMQAADALERLTPQTLESALVVWRAAIAVGEPERRRVAAEAVATRARNPELVSRAWRAAAAAAAETLPRAEVRVRLQRALDAAPGDQAAAEALSSLLQVTGETEALRALCEAQLRAHQGASRWLVVWAQTCLQLGDPAAEVLERMERQLIGTEPSADLLLDAARLAAGAGAIAMADSWFERAGEGRDATAASARLEHARFMAGTGSTSEALGRLERHLAESPRDGEALELLAELRGELGDWPGAAQALQRRFALPEAPEVRARHAVAIAEIIRQVSGDHRAAAGWFKRAADLVPGDLGLVERMLDELEHLPPGEVPAHAVRETLSRASEALTEAVRERPEDPERWRASLRLATRAGEAEPAERARGALEWLGANAGEEVSRPPGPVGARTFATGAALDAAARERWVTHAGEGGRAGDVFRLLAPVLVEIFADRLPPGAPRLSSRTFPAWQSVWRDLATTLDAHDIELWSSGPTGPLEARLLPQPALLLPTSLLERGLDPAQAFELAQRVDGLREGRLLFERHPRACAAAICRLANAISPGLAEASGDAALDEGMRDRLDRRAEGLPRRLRERLVELRSQGARVELTGLDTLAVAIRATRDRVGWLACGALGVALDRVVFDTVAAAREAHARPGAAASALVRSARGRALLEYAASPEAGMARRHLFAKGPS